MNYPLGQNAHDNEDIKNMIDTLLTENFTMGKQVENFEKIFADYIGAKYAVMVNSGSSANLLAIGALANHKFSNKINPGDEILVPVLCWATSVFPLIQYNFTPIFVDVDSSTLNVDLKDLKSKITNKTKGIMLVHVLGNCTNMNELMKIVKDNNLILIEDTCESLGSLYSNKFLGTFGEIGTYSFYYSHHITTMEGGMVVTDNEELFELIKCLRAHGWSRNLKNKEEIAHQNPDVDPRFTFVNLGYNVRPMEIQAAMGVGQLAKLKVKNDNRKINFNKIKEKLISDSRNFLSFVDKYDETDAAWFGITLFINKDANISNYLQYLTDSGVENRPIITGNMVRQPVIKDLYPHLNPEDFTGAEKCHFKGFFIGLPSNLMSDDSINELVEILLNYQEPTT